MSIGRIEIEHNEEAEEHKAIVDVLVEDFLAAAVGPDVTVSSVDEAWRWIFEIQDDTKNSKARKLSYCLNTLMNYRERPRLSSIPKHVVDVWQHLAVSIILAGDSYFTFDIVVDGNSPEEFDASRSFPQITTVGETTVYPYESTSDCVILEGNNGESYVCRADSLERLLAVDEALQQFIGDSRTPLVQALEGSIKVKDSGINIVVDGGVLFNRAFEHQFVFTLPSKSVSK